MADMDVDPPATAVGKKDARDDGKDKKRFEVKKVCTRITPHLVGSSPTVERCGALGMG